ncbi:hypothetical protein TorRG33x02_048290, partial [Trema orientale]
VGCPFKVDIRINSSSRHRGIGINLSTWLGQRL